jgi:hypothetical protein
MKEGKYRKYGRSANTTISCEGKIMLLIKMDLCFPTHCGNDVIRKRHMEYATVRGPQDTPKPTTAAIWLDMRTKPNNNCGA